MPIFNPPSSSSSSNIFDMPTLVAPGNTLTIPANYQALKAIDLVIHGDLVVHGDLVEVN